MALKRVPKDMRETLKRMFVTANEFCDIGVDEQVRTVVAVLQRRGNVADILDALTSLLGHLIQLEEFDQAYKVDCMISRLIDSQR